MSFTEIDNCIEVCNNSVVELIIRLLNSYSVLGPRSLVGLITSQAQNSVPKHCIRSITYNY